MFAGRFLVRYDPYGLFRRDLAPRLSWPRAIRWCRLFFSKTSSRCRAGCCTPLLVWTSVHRIGRSCALGNGGKLVGKIHRVCLATIRPKERMKQKTLRSDVLLVRRKASTRVIPAAHSSLSFSVINILFNIIKFHGTQIKFPRNEKRFCRSARRHAPRPLAPRCGTDRDYHRVSWNADRRVPSLSIGATRAT